MKFLSLFSGIEAASVAWCAPLGWECVGVAEIEKFPCAVLAHHYPSVPNLGDITKISEDSIKAMGHIDLIVGGFPCQDLSVAGKRAGLKNEDGKKTRSGLFFTAIDIVRYARKHCGLRWLVLENVPGLFSSNGGKDFTSVVEEISGLADIGVPENGWGTEGAAVGPEGFLEWAVLDAQWFGVAQRRRRVFIVSDFGNWKDRESVLFERESLLRDTAPSREKGKRVAGYSPSSIGGYSEGCGTIRKSGGDLGGGSEVLINCYENHAQDSRVKDCGDLAPQLNAKAGTGGNNLPLVQQGERVCVCRMREGKDGGGKGPLISDDLSLTLATGNDQTIAYTAPTITSSNDPSRSPQSSEITQQVAAVHAATMAVRRLTPVECERLQGFPDNYTKISDKTADGPRYKALGNSMAVPVMRWIGNKFNMA